MRERYDIGLTYERRTDSITARRAFAATRVRERIEPGWSLDLASRPGTGTQVSAVVPA